jgi:hypothetical protein
LHHISCCPAVRCRACPAPASCRRAWLWLRPFWDGEARQRAVSLWSIGSWGGSGLCSLFGGFVAQSLAFGKQLKSDQPFEIHTYLGAVHMFDATNVNAAQVNEGHKVQYDHAAASDSYDRVRAFLDHWVRGKLASK